MTVTIREALPQDAMLIADLSRKTFYDTFAAQNTKENMDKFMQEQFTHAALVAEVGAPGNLFLLLCVDKAPAGYACLREHANATDRMELARIYVVREFIGNGVGRSLMQACLDAAIAKNKKAMWLGVWEKNERAIRFYKAWGFEKRGEHCFLLGNDVQRDWTMEKTLA